MSMELKKFVMAFDQVVQQNIAQKSQQLGKGQCQDFPEYKRKVGEIAGLEAAAGLARDMLRQIEVAEDAGFDDDDKATGTQGKGRGRGKGK